MNAHSFPIVKICNLCKDFSGVRVLDDINLDVNYSEIHGLVGENGAGKSTLAKIICGIHEPTLGEVYIENKKVNIFSTHTAMDLGIALIHQEPLVFPDLNVAENVFMGQIQKSNKRFMIDWSNMYKETQRLLNILSLKLNAKDKVKGFSIADQQMVEVISVLSRNAKLIVMDETTASLTSKEVESLFKIITDLQKHGKSIIFISHRIEEILKISNRITILRDGRKVGTYLTRTISKHEIIKKMIGSKIRNITKKEKNNHGKIVLSVENLSISGKFENISFDIREGEIVGLTGLVGAGRSEVARTIFGITPAESGIIKIDDRIVNMNTPKRAKEYGIAYIPEDRQLEGLFLPFALSRNMTFAVPDLIYNHGYLNSKNEISISEKYLQKLQIKAQDLKQPVEELSGGNQQKVVLAKWLLTNPKILIVDEPTHGIDVGAKQEIYYLLNQLAAQGIAILMISSELPEILMLADSIIVMYEGKIVEEFYDKKEFTEKKIINAMVGNVLKETSRC
jgi:ABC-type sugar transport system ATPase subunit